MHPFADLSAYLDGALPDERRAEVGRHLAGCEICSARLAELRGTARPLGDRERRRGPRLRGVDAPRERVAHQHGQRRARRRGSRRRPGLPRSRSWCRRRRR
ncbi:MAG: hypothetical protein E6I51_06980 [Chloroflexi bacterium]|nr:MAG: hypothetical protein E6I51_06980 [Chloroflexota bacterium]